MKNGFTLAELLGVIAILGVIALITVPAINRSLDSGREDLYETQIEQLKKGAEDYYTEHLDEMPNMDGDMACKTIEELQKDGYLPLDIKNPKTDKPFSALTKVCVEKKSETSGSAIEVDGAEYVYTVEEE